MTEEEKTRFLLMENDIALIKQRMEEICTAILGSNLTKDGGMVRRIIELEINYDKLENIVLEDQKKTAKMEIYQKIMWTSIGGVAMAVLAYIFEIVFKK